MKHDIYDQESSTGIDRETGGSKGKSPKPGSEQEAMWKKMKAAGTPGPAHKALGAFVGDWKAEVKCWMDPDRPPEVTQAESSVAWALDGHFLEEEFHGKMMGEDFTGHCMMGFDNTKQKFNCVWIDDKHTSMFTSEGRGDSTNRTITLEGKMDCPATGQKDMPIKQIFHVFSPEKHVLEMFNDGKRTMEITYTRP